MTRAGTTIALSLSVALTLVACTGTEPQPVPTPTVTVTPSGDGVLRVGTAFSLGGSAKASGAAQVAGVELAIRDINLAGGVNGAPVEVFHRDGSDPAAFAALVEKGVDVVIGGSSVARVEELAPLATDAGIPLLSAAAPFAAPTPFTFSLASAPTSVATGLAESIAATGATRVTLVRAEAAEYELLETQLVEAMDVAGLTLATTTPLTAQAGPTAAEVATSTPDVVVVAAPRKAAVAAVLVDLVAAGYGADTLWFAGSSVGEWKKPLPSGALDGAGGVTLGSPTDAAFVVALEQTDPGLTSTTFAAEAYDATVLAALAAEFAGDDGGPSIAHQLRAASAEGIPCASFAECLDVLTTEPDVDYVGRSGAVDIGEDGNGGGVRFRLWEFSSANKPTLVGK